MHTTSQQSDLLTFWFGSPDITAEPIPALRKRWFAGGPAFDAEVRERFGALLDTPDAIEAWATDAAGSLAAIVALDQFPRNIFRSSTNGFAFDFRARRQSLRVIEAGLDRQMGPSQRSFAYLPLMHTEDLAIQERAVALYTQLALDAEGTPSAESARYAVPFATRHRDIVARFGRFPGRNLALGREDTPEERAWLQEGGETFGQR